MEFVTDLIAIGNRRDARDIEKLKEANIEAVLCTAARGRVPRKRYAEAGISCYKLSIYDNEPLPQEKEKEFWQALEFIDEAVRQEKRCLVQCAFGISRSTAILAAWLHTRLDIPWEEATEQIRRARPRARPQPQPFASIKQLVDAEITAQP